MSNFFVFSPFMFFWHLIILYFMTYLYKVLQGGLWKKALLIAEVQRTFQTKNWELRFNQHRLGQFMKRKSISGSRGAENISNKRLRVEVQPAQTTGLETVKRFLNVHLHCTVSNPKRIRKISTLPPPGKISADDHAFCPPFLEFPYRSF